MKYNVRATLINPDDEMEYTFNSIIFSFIYDEDQYGNGYYCRIEGKNFYRQVIDLRYNKTFDSNNKEKWIENWIKNLWNGDNGAFVLKSYEIKKEN
mgnify:CR=1 FL=1